MITGAITDIRLTGQQFDGERIRFIFKIILILAIYLLIHQNAIALEMSLCDVPQFMRQYEQQPGRIFMALEDHNSRASVEDSSQRVGLFSAWREIRDMENGNAVLPANIEQRFKTYKVVSPS